MGACQSTATVATGTVGNNPAKASERSQATRSTHKTNGGDGSDSDADSRAAQQPQQIHIHPVYSSPTRMEEINDKNDNVVKRSQKFENRPGYSSGGSSFIESSDEEPCASRMGSSRSCTRHDKLCEWKEELGNGCLTSKIVRIETDFGRDIEDVYEGVHDGPILGEGVAGVVRLVIHRETRVHFAVKVLNLGLLESDAVLECLREEIFTMCQLDHPNILRLEEVYESETQIFLIQELCKGGDLFDRLDEKPEDEPYHYSEVQCAKLVKQMLSAVRYLHSRHVVHRDLKLENFLFEDKKSDDLKMIDFGLSKHFKGDGQLLHEAVGTPYTCAPEIIRGSYNSKADMWSMGVITYLLLSGESPFGGIYEDDKLDCVRQNILCCHLPFEPKEIWDEVSSEAKNFVRRLLTLDPNERPAAREAQLDPWLQKYGMMDVEGSKALNSDLINNLVKFKDYSEMHRVLLDVLSFALLPEQIHKLKAEFQKMDPDGDGEITLEELKEVLLNRAEVGSLGSLSEEEVEDIFNALRTQDSETTIRWHEFIAAGLSRTDFDDRNLKLAFDRLDYDRKGYITHKDMCEMLCTSDGKMDSNVRKMWHDGLKEIKCKANKITFEEFQKFLKGQVPKDAMLKRDSSGRRLSGRALLSTTLALQSVPEDTATTKLARDSDGNLITFQVAQIPLYRSSRAASVSVPPSNSLVQDGDDDYDLPLESDAFRMRQEFRMSVLHASKLFDQMRQARQTINPSNPAGLTMIAGARRPSIGGVSCDKETTVKMAVACKRSGRRNRHGRKKTKSDLSLLINQLQEVQ